MKIGDIFLALGVDTAAFKPAVEKAAGEAGTAAGKTLGETLKANMTKAMAGVGAAVGTGIAASVQDFVKFDDQMRTVFSILPGISKDAMGKMEDDVKSLSIKMGVLPEKVIPGLYDALSSGIPQDNVFAFMESATKAAVAGGADTQAVVKVLSATINAFGLDASKTGELTDSFFNAINRGVTTFPELSASMSGVAPHAAAMGLSIDEVLASITAMTLQGTPTAQAVTQIDASLTALQRTTPQMTEALHNLGFETGQAALDALGYQGTMEALRGEAENMGVELIELTGRTEGSAAMLQLTGENAAKANELLGTFGDTAGLTTAAFETMESGVGGAARRLGAQVKVALIDIGEQFQALGPIFTAFGPTMGRLLGAGIGAVGGLVGKGFMTLANSAPVKTAIGAASRVMTRLAGDAMDLGLRALAFGKNIALDMASKLQIVLQDAWSRIATSRIGTAVGTAIGGAMAAAQEAAATGVEAIKKLGVRIAAMAIPLAPAGTTVGTAIGGAITAGIAAGLLVAVGAVAFVIADQMHQHQDEITDAIFGDGASIAHAGKEWAFIYTTALAQGLTDSDAIKRANEQLSMTTGVDIETAQTAARRLGLLEGTALGTGIVEGVNKVQVGPMIIGAIDQSASQWAPLGVAIGEPVGEGVGEGTAHGIIHTSGTVSDAYRDMLDVAFVDAYIESQAAATALGAGLPGSVGDAIYDHATEALTGIEHLRDVLENGLTPRQIALEAMGAKYIKDVRKGMESEIPGARQTAQQVAGEAIEAIEEAGLNGTKGQKGFKRQGEYYIELLNSGMTAMEARAFLTGQGVSKETIDGIESEYPAFTTAGEDAAEKVHGGFTKKPWESWGAGSAGEWISGFVNGISHKQDFIERKLDNLFKSNSPPKVAPNIDKHGFKTGQLWAEALGKGAAMLGLDMLKPNFSMPAMTGHSTMELHHTVDIRGDAGVLDERKVADYLNEGAAGFAWNLEHAMSAVNSG